MKKIREDSKKSGGCNPIPIDLPSCLPKNLALAACPLLRFASMLKVKSYHSPLLQDTRTFDNVIDLVTTLSTQLASSLRDTNVEQSQHTQFFFPTKHQHTTLRVEEEACTGKDGSNSCRLNLKDYIVSKVVSICIPPPADRTKTFGQQRLKWRKV